MARSLGWSILLGYISSLCQIHKQTKTLEHTSFRVAMALEQQKWKETNLTKSYELFEWYTVFLENLSTKMQKESLVCKHQRRVLRDP